MGASIFFTAIGRNVNYDEKETYWEKSFELLLLSVQVL
jgi:hypothetical protein